MASDAFDPAHGPRKDPRVAEGLSRTPGQSSIIGRMPRLCSFEGPDQNGKYAKVWTQRIPAGTISFDNVDSHVILGGAQTIWRKDRTVLRISRLDLSEDKAWTKLEWRSRSKFADVTLPLESRLLGSSRREQLGSLVNAFSKGNLVDAWRTLMEHFLGLSTPTENSPIPEFLTSGPFTAERALSPEVVSMAYRTAHDVRAVVVHPSAGKFLKITQGALPESAILPLSDGIFRDHSGTKRERALLKNLLDRNISVRLRAYYEIALAAFSLHGGSIDRFQAGISGGHRVSRFREAIESMAPHYQLALVGGQDTLHEIAIAIAGRAQSVRLKSFHAFRKIDSVTFFASASGDLTLSFHLPAGVHLPFVMIRSTGTAPVIDRVVALVQTIGESGDIPWELLRSLGAKIPNPDGTFSEMPGPLPWSVESEKWARALQRIFPSFSRTEIYDRYFMKDQDPHIPGITSSHHARIDLGIPGGGINAEIRIAKDGTTEITILGNIRSWGRKRTFVFGGSTPLGQSEREMLVRGLCRHPGMRGWFGRYWGLRALERAAAESRRATDSKTNDSEGSSLP